MNLINDVVKSHIKSIWIRSKLNPKYHGKYFLYLLNIVLTTKIIEVSLIPKLKT